MKKNQIDIITMGCSKNLVDSEALMKQFEANGYHCVHDPKRPQGEIAVINTCGFIESAKEESINTILEMVQLKESGRLKKLFVMGCLSERYKDELEKEIPQVDKYYGKFNYKQLLADLGKAYVPSCDGQRCITTPSHYAYLKIAEGCDRHCAYCAIPLMTGKFKSRAKQSILNEVNSLVASGVKEFQVIAQELTYYGVDIDGKHHIADLVDSIASVDGVRWIRLHYAYPYQFPMELLDVMNSHPNVCRYLDIALQHVSDNVLKRMHRHETKQQIVDLINTIREKVPGIHLRTTLMVGFPGETKEEFEELCDFVRIMRFERMGAFMYSEEDGTYSAKHYKDDVPKEEKQRRLDVLMSIQENVSEEVEAKELGTVLPVIIDRREGDYYVGRTEFSSPEVDPEVLIPVSDRRLRIGCFYDVLMESSDKFDIFGKVVKNTKAVRIK